MCVDAKILSLIVTYAVHLCGFVNVYFAYFVFDLGVSPCELACRRDLPTSRPAPEEFSGHGVFYNVFLPGLLLFTSKTRNAGTTAGPVLRGAASAGEVLGISSSWASGLETYRWVLKGRLEGMEPHNKSSESE